MSRKARIEFEGAMYHVFQRGNNREFIFKDDKEKRFFLKQIKDCMQAYDYEILAYVIMDNHYHLIIQTYKIPLHQIMHNINNIFSKFYNKRQERTGHVFEERYNSKIIEDDAYLIWVLRYIHRNPVRAQMCKDVKEYKWNSDLFYRRNINSFVNIDFILNLFSTNRNKALEVYLRLMNSDEKNKDEDYEKIKSEFEAICSINTKDDIIENTKNHFRERIELSSILKNLTLSEEDFSLIKSGSRRRNLTNIKKEFIKIAINNKYSYEEIGKFIGISQSAVSKLIIQ